MGIVYGREDNGSLACTKHEPVTHFPEYFTYSMLLVLISCAVYQMMISALKAVFLALLSAAYLVIVHYQCYNMFDNQDFLLQTHDGYELLKMGGTLLTSCVLIVRNCPHDYLETRWMVIAIVISFTIALIIHGHQTEATYRLDFLWKLQATGEWPRLNHPDSQSIDNLQSFQS